MSTAREQFEAEAAALVQIICQMTDAGQFIEAGQLLDQYALLNPADPQIAELRKSIERGAARPLTADCPQVLERTESIYILQDIPYRVSGLPASVFGKCMLMEEKFGYRSSILTVKHDINLRKKEVWLKTFAGNRKMMSPGVRMLNAFEYFQKSYANALANKAIYEKPDGADGLRYVEEAEGIYAAYDGDTLIRRDTYSGYGGSLRMEQHYLGGKREKDVVYDDWGYLNNIVEYDQNSDDSCAIKYYSTDGVLCIEADCKLIGKRPLVINLTVYNDDGSVLMAGGNEAKLTALFLSKILDCNKFNLLVFEDVTKSIVAAYLDKKQTNSAAVVMMHTTFLEDSYDLSSNVREDYRYFCQSLDNYEGVVFLTGSERDDFIGKYGRVFQDFVIPHPYYHKIHRVDFDNRDSRKAVILARLAPEKQLGIAAEIFSIAVRALPDLKLEIYGAGGANDDDMDNIMAKIKSLGMENNISIMDYTDDIISVFSSASMLIMTSRFEAYPLTLFESICNGCPAFAFDIKYGPSDIIKDGETGFLFPRGDIERFAAKIIEYFSDTRMQRKMSENCYNDAARFSTEKFLENWTSMAQTLYERHSGSGSEGANAS